MAGFEHRLRQANHKRGLLVQGLDPVNERIPPHIHDKWHFNNTMLIVMFLTPIIDVVAPWVAGFKPNISFFLAFDDERNGKFWGQEALSIICRYIRQNYPDHILILDAKDGDIGKSNNGYTKRAFYGYDADAVTWDPYLGAAIADQAKQYPNKGFLVLGRTSNKEGTALQNLRLADSRRVFEATVDEWMKLRKVGVSVGFVAGATHPEELAEIRRGVGAAPLLVPGVGTQGGDAGTVAKAGFGGRYGNLLINVSSGSLYAGGGEDYASSAQDYMLSQRSVIHNSFHSR